MPHLEKDLGQRRKIGRHGSEKARQKSDVPKRQHCRKHEDDERQDHNIYTLFEIRAITKETTKSRSRIKFVVFMRLKKNETNRSKGSKVMIIRR